MPDWSKVVMHVILEPRERISVFMRQHKDVGEQSVLDRIARRSLLAGFALRAGRFFGIPAVGADLLLRCPLPSLSWTWIAMLEVRLPMTSFVS